MRIKSGNGTPFQAENLDTENGGQKPLLGKLKKECNIVLETREKPIGTRPESGREEGGHPNPNWAGTNQMSRKDQGL